MIGSASSSSIKASKIVYIRKSVFCLSNVDSSYSTNNIMDYIKSIGVRLLTCFELKSSSHNPADSKAFRICIVAEDKSALLNSDNWAVGVAIRQWYRKSKGNGDRDEAAKISDKTKGPRSDGLAGQGHRELGDVGEGSEAGRLISASSTPGAIDTSDVILDHTMQ